MIDPGHGGIDGGANSSDFLEKDINLAVAKRISKELKDLGAKVALTRKEDVSLEHLFPGKGTRHRRDLNARVAIIEQNKSDIFLSIHVNSNPRKPATTGMIVFYNKNNSNSENLAKAIQYHGNKLMEKQGFKQHGPEPGDYFLLRETSSTGVIIELGFMSNQKEKQLLKQGNYQRDLANVIVEGVKQYFSIIDYEEALETMKYYNDESF